jgi:hypothetical protein
MDLVKRFGLLVALWAIGFLATGLIPYVWSHEPGSRRVAWLILVVCTMAGAGALTWVELKLRRIGQPDQRDVHDYLSTGCLHGEHAYCQSMTGTQGQKRPGRCKFCDARCSCPCHAETDAGLPR